MPNYKPEFEDLLVTDLKRYGDDVVGSIAIYIGNYLSEFPPEKTAEFKADLDRHIVFFRDAGNGIQDWD